MVSWRHCWRMPRPRVPRWLCGRACGLGAGCCRGVGWSSRPRVSAAARSGPSSCWPKRSSTVPACRHRGSPGPWGCRQVRCPWLTSARATTTRCRVRAGPSTVSCTLCRRRTPLASVSTRQLTSLARSDLDPTCSGCPRRRPTAPRPRTRRPTAGAPRPPRRSMAWTCGGPRASTRQCADIGLACPTAPWRPTTVAFERSSRRAGSRHLTSWWPRTGRGRGCAPAW
mmetsp:Transcript_98751/g.316637  ORF Transcript_98751/g.316637 Transcript_98751/m.316637 type:complete len:226 (+) Transcript_98751:521-1198(+)